MLDTPRNGGVRLGRLLAVAVLILGVAWMCRHWGEIQASVTFHPWLLVLLVPLILASVTLIGLTNQMVAGVLEASLPTREWLALGFASTLANYILPMRAGAALRAAYYKRRCGLALGAFASSMAVLYVVTALVYGTAGLVATAAMGGWHWSSGRTVILSLVFLIGTSFSTVVVLAKGPRAGLHSGRLGHLETLRRGLNQLSDEPRFLARVSLVVAAGLGLTVLRIWISFQALGATVNGWQALLVGSMAGLSLFITITPAALGIREAVVAVTSTVAGLSPEIGVAAAVIDRLAAVLTVLAIGPFAYPILSRALAKEP